MRAFALFVLLLVLAGVIGACLAYPAYELTSTFAGWPFHRVAGRIAMLVLALEVVGYCRYLHVGSRRDLGYGLPRPAFLAQCALWCLIGIATAAVGAAFLWSTGLRVLASDAHPTLAHVLGWFLVGLSSGIAVALIEETVMRGALHTAIDRESGPWAAALLTAPLFAALHFFAKVRIPVAELGWHSGFDLLTRSFAPLAHPSLVYDAFASWVAVGLLLSLTRVLTGNIAVALGLHAGWVVVLRMLQEATVRGTTTDYSIWLGRFDGLLGLWLLPWAAVIGAGLWLTRRVWVEAARSGYQASGASMSNR